MDYNIIVIGGGPGGYYAAIRAAQLGAKVALVEKENLGGTCLNWGCIPTKALYRTAEVINTIKDAESYGIEVSKFKVNIDRIQERKNSIITQLTDGITKLMKGNKIAVYKGAGLLKDKNTVSIDTGEDKIIDIKGNNIIIATGSKEWIPPIPGVSLEGILSSSELLNLKEIPEKLTIIGGGVIGIEFASIFNSFGSQVTIIELLPNILNRMDIDIVKRFEASLRKKGIKILKETKVTKIEKEDDRYIVYSSGKKGDVVIESDKVLISIGRIPKTDNLNLQEIGVEMEAGRIKVDSSFETSIPGIYAIGDVLGENMLAHVASHQGVSAVEAILNYNNTKQHSAVPSCIFSFPEISSVGITEGEAKDKGLNYRTSKVNFASNGKALTLGETEGFIKVIANDNNEVIGVHIMGPHASDLIPEGTLAISRKLKIEDIINTIHAHPTLAEAFYEAVLGLEGIAIHALP
ncbi:dihydrolipoyl dehydrogenase [Alkaliphilus peptidifermentans]|uniref:Dihydrolipoyl dehydrogenase n=1 Tax=Alkaliphilus peptidifermentans DSM 18978 TaxID=1120976 RepID=A0A1G5FGM3_9FIRM|nr:dihydrolipoyl dehydrogenase [Alkaliphilus peptidifermentans]SCY38274.1 dihydrolipoamide dehydrogenase [Alkaliphilus peptidifermentans DSM 18978]